MAKKRNVSQIAAFELTGDLFALQSDGMGDLDIHPSISKYADKVGRIASTSLANSLEMGSMSVASPARLSFISFGSGSSGNCSYLGTPEGGILIDAGVNADEVLDGMRRHGINPKSVRGIILTHDHTDHVKYVYPLVKKRTDVGIYCTPKTLTGLLRRHSISRRIKDFHRPIYKEFPFKLGPFEITPFDVSHDGTDNVGYFIEHGNQKMAVATDLGCITPRVDFYMRQANHIVIESNYDARMLATGPYPMHLKARIVADNGHLDNCVTGKFLAEIVSAKLRNVFLCHLSQDNNTPQLALATVKNALIEAGVTAIGDATGSMESRDLPLQLTALPRREPSLLFTLK